MSEVSLQSPDPTLSTTVRLRADRSVVIAVHDRGRSAQSIMGGYYSFEVVLPPVSVASLAKALAVPVEGILSAMTTMFTSWWDIEPFLTAHDIAWETHPQHFS